MQGGADADTFIFALGPNYNPGVDKILDFEIGVDHLQFNSPGSANMAELNFAQVGNDTVITYDNTAGSLTLVGVELSDLSASNFVFY
jgi:hypothetical protein